MVQRPSQVLCSTPMSKVPVRRMSSEKLFLLSQRVLHRVTSVDILLTPVHHPNETELQGVSSTRQDVQGIRAGVHQVQLCEDSDGSKTARVDGTC